MLPPFIFTVSLGAFLLHLFRSLSLTLSLALFVWQEEFDVEANGQIHTDKS